MVRDIKIYIRLMCEDIINDKEQGLKENAKFILKHLDKEV